MMATASDLVLHHGLFATLDRSNPSATAVAIRESRFVAVGSDADVLALAGPTTRVIDLKGRRVLPGFPSCPSSTSSIPPATSCAS
jgi:predicted amidohydrolase YtcJ